jgi:hypothetical protein
VQNRSSLCRQKLTQFLVQLFDLVSLKKHPHGPRAAVTGIKEDFDALTVWLPSIVVSNSQFVPVFVGYHKIFYLTHFDSHNSPQWQRTTEALLKFRPTFFHPFRQPANARRIIHDGVSNLFASSALHELCDELTEHSDSKHAKDCRDSARRKHKPVEKLLHFLLLSRLADQHSSRYFRTGTSTRSSTHIASHVETLAPVRRLNADASIFAWNDQTAIEMTHKTKRQAL